MCSPTLSTERAAAGKLNGATFILLACLAAIGPMSVDLSLPGVPAIERELHATPAAATATVSVFFAGLALGQLLAGPLSDRLGRRHSVLAGLALYFAGSLLAGLAHSVALLLLGRAVQALGASAVTVSGRAVVRDLFDHRGTASTISTLMLVTTVAPIVAPSLGSALLALGGWRWIFAGMLVFSGALVPMALRHLAESRSEEARQQARDTHPLVIYRRLLQSRRLVGYLLAAAFNNTCLFTFIASAPLIIMNAYHVKPVTFSLIFAANALGLAGANQLNRMLLRRRSPDRLLLSSARNAALMAALLLLFTVTLWGGLPALLLIIFFVASSTCIVQANTMAGALSVDPRHAGSIAALFGATGFAAGTLSSYVAGLLYDGTPRGTTLTITVGLAGVALSIRYLAVPRSTAPGVAQSKT